MKVEDKGSKPCATISAIFPTTDVEEECKDLSDCSSTCHQKDQIICILSFHVEKYPWNPERQIKQRTDHRSYLF